MVHNICEYGVFLGNSDEKCRKISCSSPVEVMCGSGEHSCRRGRMVTKVTTRGLKSVMPTTSTTGVSTSTEGMAPTSTTAYTECGMHGAKGAAGAEAGAGAGEAVSDVGLRAVGGGAGREGSCLLYTSPSPRDRQKY